MPPEAPPASRAEVMVWAMAREVEGADLAVQGIATPLVTVAFELAKRTVAPDLAFGFAIGNSFGDRPGPVSLTDPEARTLGAGAARFDFVEAAGEFLPWANPMEFFRPAQVDASGATNNVVIGEYGAPKLRLPGAAGIPDVSVTSRTGRIYVPRHSPRVFVERLDFCSGLGWRAGAGGGPVRVFTDLCTMVLRGGRLGVEALMPGVELDQVQEATGFALSPGEVGALEAPPPEVLALLRDEVDPAGLRDLDFLPTRQRFARLYAIAAAEEAARRR